MVLLNEPKTGVFLSSFSKSERKQILLRAVELVKEPSYRNPDAKKQVQRLESARDWLLKSDPPNKAKLLDVNSLLSYWQGFEPQSNDELLADEYIDQFIQQDHKERLSQKPVAVDFAKLSEAFHNGRRSACLKAIENEKLWRSLDDQGDDDSDYPPNLGDLKQQAAEALDKLKEAKNVNKRQRLLGNPPAINLDDAAERIEYATGELDGFEQLCKAYENLFSPKDWESGAISEPSSDWLAVMESRLAVWASKTKQTKTITPTPSNSPVAAKTAPIVGKSKSRFPDPAPGFISQVVDYNLATAQRRQPELALFGGIALQSTLASRKVRSGHKGRPNLLIVALSGTASGKQHAREVNSDILKLAGCEALLLGNDFTSDIALFRALESAGAGLSQIDEFGRVLAGASKPGTRQHEIVTSLMMLATSEGDASCKAKSYADASRSLSLCYPCLSIYATGTVEPFFESIGAGSVDDGFLGRLLVVRGRDQVPNSRSSTPIGIPSEILQTASEWYAEGGNLINVNQGSAIPVERIIPTEPIANGLFAEFSEKADALAWKGNRFRLWGRASEKASKLAVVYACSVSRESPIIDEAAARWGIAIATKTTEDLVSDCENWLSSSIHEAHCNELYRMIDSAKNRSLTGSQLCNVARRWKSKERNEILNALHEQGRISITITEGQSPTTTFQAIG